MRAIEIEFTDSDCWKYAATSVIVRIDFSVWSVETVRKLSFYLDCFFKSVTFSAIRERTHTGR